MVFILFLNENEDENEDYFVPVLLLSCFIIYLLNENENEDENEDYFCSRATALVFYYLLFKRKRKLLESCTRNARVSYYLFNEDKSYTPKAVFVFVFVFVIVIVIIS